MLIMSTKKIVKILVVLVVILAGASFYFYRHAKLAENANSAQAIQAEAKSLAVKVGKLIVLPTDEIPTIATVSDPEALKSQSFFADAKKGDKVLIYTNAKKAILYSPELNKIVTVAPLNIGDQKDSVTKPAIESTTVPAGQKDKF